jgi:hypothetical protein
VKCDTAINWICQEESDKACDVSADLVEYIKPSIYEKIDEAFELGKNLSK